MRFRRETQTPKKKKKKATGKTGTHQEPTDPLVDQREKGRRQELEGKKALLVEEKSSVGREPHQPVGQRGESTDANEKKK